MLVEEEPAPPKKNTNVGIPALKFAEVQDFYSFRMQEKAKGWFTKGVEKNQFWDHKAIGVMFEPGFFTVHLAIEGKHEKDMSP